MKSKGYQELHQNHSNNNIKVKIKCLSKTLKTELGDINAVHHVNVKKKKMKSETEILKHHNATLDDKKNDKDDRNLKSVDAKVE